MVRAEIVQDVEARTLQPLISNRVKRGSIVCSDSWRVYTGIASKGVVHRRVNHGERECSDGKGDHINGLEGSWEYLKRKLAAKGGIHRDTLFLYSGEYIWRYNHRKESDKMKLTRVPELLEREVRGSFITIPNFFPDHQLYLLVRQGAKRITMCDRICYRKKGDLYECIRISRDGDEELLGKGSRDDIISWLSSHGLGYVQKEVLLQDIELLCEEKKE